MAGAASPQEVTLHRRAVLSEHVRQHLIGNIRFGEPVMIEFNATAGKLVLIHRNGGDKISENAFYRVGRNAPDAKETKDVIDAERVKVATHLLKAAFPPGKVILHHARPVVSGESPVLSLHR